MEDDRGTNAGAHMKRWFLLFLALTACSKEPPVQSPAPQKPVVPKPAPQGPAEPKIGDWAEYSMSASSDQGSATVRAWLQVLDVTKAEVVLDVQLRAEQGSSPIDARLAAPFSLVVQRGDPPAVVPEYQARDGGCLVGERHLECRCRTLDGRAVDGPLVQRCLAPEFGPLRLTAGFLSSSYDQISMIGHGATLTVRLEDYGSGAPARTAAPRDFVEGVNWDLPGGGHFVLQTSRGLIRFTGLDGTARDATPVEYVASLVDLASRADFSADAGTLPVHPCRSSSSLFRFGRMTRPSGARCTTTCFRTSSSRSSSRRADAAEPSGQNATTASHE